MSAGILEDRDEKNKGGALFFREYGRTASYYANRTFEPVFESTPDLIIPADRTTDIQKAKELCGDSYQCKYDYSVSLNRDLAFYTLQYQDGYVNTKKMSKQRGKWPFSQWFAHCLGRSNRISNNRNFYLVHRNTDPNEQNISTCTNTCSKTKNKNI